MKWLPKTKQKTHGEAWAAIPGTQKIQSASENIARRLSPEARNAWIITRTLPGGKKTRGVKVQWQHIHRKCSVANAWNTNTWQQNNPVSVRVTIGQFLTAGHHQDLYQLLPTKFKLSQFGGKNAAFFCQSTAANFFRKFSVHQRAFKTAGLRGLMLTCSIIFATKIHTGTKPLTWVQP